MEPLPRELPPALDAAVARAWAASSFKDRYCSLEGLWAYEADATLSASTPNDIALTDLEALGHGRSLMPFGRNASTAASISRRRCVNTSMAIPDEQQPVTPPGYRSGEDTHAATVDAAL
jgi:hypothetical protein